MSSKSIINNEIEIIIKYSLKKNDSNNDSNKNTIVADFTLVLFLCLGISAICIFFIKDFSKINRRELSSINF